MDFSLIESLANEEIGDLYNLVIEGKIVTNQLWCFECANGIYACYCDANSGRAYFNPNAKGTFTFYHCYYGGLSTAHACGIGVSGYGFAAGGCRNIGNVDSIDRCI